MREVKVNRFLTLKIENREPSQKGKRGKITAKTNQPRFVTCEKQIDEMTETEIAAEIRFYLVESGVIPRPQQAKAPQFATNRHIKMFSKVAAG